MTGDVRPPRLVEEESVESHFGPGGSKAAHSNALAAALGPKKQDRRQPKRVEGVAERAYRHQRPGWGWGEVLVAR
eukprot:3847757-Prymnesium_polylepis.1